jgi:three-Cys-motif partner protein
MAPPTGVLWERPRHTAAKHQLLTGYLDAWIGIIGNRFRHALLVEGFAGPGEYLDHAPGSPLLMLDAFLTRTDRNALQPTFHYLFMEADEARYQHLCDLVAQTARHAKVDIRLVQGDFSTLFPLELERITRTVGGQPPTFAFIDPFGAGDDAAPLASELVALPRCEALMYVPIKHLARFVTVSDMRATLDRLYRGNRWKRAARFDDLPRRRQVLQDEMVDLLKQSCSWVRPFEIVPDSGQNSYTLFFGTNNKLGLRRMKASMWKVDPVGGTTFRDNSSVDHPVLFEATPDLDRLEQQLRDHFANRSFGIDVAEDFTLTQTAFRDDKHLKPTLKASELGDRLEIVTGKPTRRRGQFPAGTVMRFVG